MDLFEQNRQSRSPLADRMRPRTLDEFVGQHHLVGKGKLLWRAIKADVLQSSIFFGPPGCGKTTLASIIANTTHSRFAQANAVTAGVSQVRDMIEEAESYLRLHGQSTYLLLDECHRWTKAQSDTILPALEKGTVKFIGSTTQNPMVSMTGGIVSRCRLFQFHALSGNDIRQTLQAAMDDKERGLGNYNLLADGEAIDHLAQMANGDARSALNALELAALTTPPTDGRIHITLQVAEECIQKKVLQCGEDQYYDMLSAFCKSLRGSDSNAALAWFARLIYAGVDPRLIARRIIAHASEDVGLANPSAMVQAVAAAQSLEHIGMPEARLSLAQAIIYVCESPKSNAVVMAIDKAFGDVSDKGLEEPVPVHLRDTHYAGAQKLGSGAGYKYPHDYEGHYVDQQYAPVGFEDKQYYVPSAMGSEEKIKQNQEKRKKTKTRSAEESRNPFES
ncbi:MAG: replication-associated recombination protein A [Christensenellales bacterium]